MSYLRYLCLFGSSLPPVVCRRADVLFMKLEVKRNQTNTNNINKTSAPLQTTGVKDEPNKHK
jgi:hypothetical protein